MSKFKIGDRVKCIREHDDNNNIVNKEGTVVGNDDYESRVAVEFDKNIYGHDCAKRAKYNHGWNIPSSKLILTVPPTRILAKLLEVLDG